MPMLSLFSLSVKRLSRQILFLSAHSKSFTSVSWPVRTEPGSGSVRLVKQPYCSITVQTTVRTCEPLKRSESNEQLVHKSDIAGAHAATVLVVNMASDEDSNEDFVTYGAPLEPLEEGTKMCAMKLSFVWICCFLLRRSCECFNKKCRCRKRTLLYENPRGSYLCISDEPIRKPVPVHEQTVKDEKGRYQRFHGAFTGGFSAGYFNTVGTKEG